MTGDDQIQSVEHQVVLLTRGELNALACPYCGAITPAGEAFCCLLMVNAVAAVLLRIDLEKQKKIAEAAEKAAVN
jgi:ribosomal protein S26